jgi:hypothetical protein
VRRRCWLVERWLVRWGAVVVFRLLGAGLVTAVWCLVVALEHTTMHPTSLPLLWAAHGMLSSPTNCCLCVSLIHSSSPCHHCVSLPPQTMLPRLTWLCGERP